MGRIYKIALVFGDASVLEKLLEAKQFPITVNQNYQQGCQVFSEKSFKYLVEIFDTVKDFINYLKFKENLLDPNNQYEVIHDIYEPENILSVLSIVSIPLEMSKLFKNPKNLHDQFKVLDHLDMQMNYMIRQLVQEQSSYNASKDYISGIAITLETAQFLINHFSSKLTIFSPEVVPSAIYYRKF